jgi:Rad3-related DNA helicase
VIVVGDPRISTKPYGRVFLDALPDAPVTRDGAAAAQFLIARMTELKARPAMLKVH